MMKSSAFLVFLTLFFSACSNFTFNAGMCEQIASDPHAPMFEECRVYNEEDAQKAFDNVSNTKVQSKESLLEFKDKESN